MADLTAPMSGNVLKLNVKVGDKVEIDDEVIIIEAMKMETPIFAIVTGIISEIKVKEGEHVNDGDVMVVIS